MATFPLCKEASKRLFVRARALVVELIPSRRIVGFVKYSTRKYIGIGLDGMGMRLQLVPFQDHSWNETMQVHTMNSVILFRCTNNNSMFSRCFLTSSSRQMGGTDPKPRKEPTDASFAPLCHPLYLKGPVSSIKPAESLQAFFNPPTADIFNPVVGAEARLWFRISA